MSKSIVSVVIGTGGANRHKYLGLVLDSFNKSLCPRKKEYILVEAGNKTRVPEKVKSRFEKYRLVHKKELFNLGWVFNVGAKLSSGNILVFHDNDLLVPRDFFTQIINASESISVGSTWKYIKYLSEDFSNKLLRRKLSVKNFQERDVIGQFPSASIHGGSVWIKRKPFFQVKGFSELFEGWGCIDDAFYLKANTCLGWKNSCDTTLFHLYHPSSGIDANKARLSNPNYRSNRKLLESMDSWSKDKWEAHIRNIRNWGNPKKYSG